MSIQSKKILFFVKSMRFLRYFRSVVEALLRRGFSVHVVFDGNKFEQPSDDSLESFKKTYPQFSWGVGPLRAYSRVNRFIIACRNIRNWAFLVRIGAVARHTERMRQHIPAMFRSRVMRDTVMERLLSSRFVDILLAFIECVTSPDAGITQYIRACNPNTVIVVYRNFPCTSPDIDYLKSARTIGLHTILLTASWDNLTTKSLIQIEPEAVFVWNEEHAVAVRNYHKVSAEKIKIVGAPQFDAWFSRRAPYQTRETFVSAHGLNRHDTFLLYISSASAGASNPDAIRLLRRLCDESVDQNVRALHIIVRPYPGYETLSAVAENGVTMLPAPAEMRRTVNDDRDFFDAVFHSCAVVALDSASFFDAMVIGRPSIVFQDTIFSNIQSAEHFWALMEQRVLYKARRDSFAKIMSSILTGKDLLAPSRMNYLARFIRPRGIGHDVGEVVTEEILKMTT